MLIKCPECELQVSDKAVSCPHCGYPINIKEPLKRTKSPRTHKRLPNGFGQITEIKDKPLRNPFRVSVTIGKNENGRPICKLLKPNAYFTTYNEAYAALVEYNKNPYDLESDVSVNQLYEKWSEEYFEKISPSSKRTITAAWAYCDPVKKMRVKDLRSRHIKAVMDQENVSPSIKSRIKSLFNLMLDYAVEYEIVFKNYARDFNTESLESKQHISYTDDELEILWNNTDNDIVNIILIQCYSGWRPAEMFNLSFDWDKMTMEGGSKTEAGKNRIVPIHPKIVDLAKKEESMLLSLNYDKYFKKYKSVINALGLNPEHKPHDGRKTFVTKAKKYDVDEYAIKYLVGHAIIDITEKTYTDRNTDWLKTEINKIA